MTINSTFKTASRQKVMHDFDLAELYDTETRTLKQSVRRNIDCFPKDFMFQLNVCDIPFQHAYW